MGFAKQPNVAGRFYPGQQSVLKQTVAELLGDAPTVDIEQPKAIIVPHAGYVYSGSVAATAYKPFLKFKHNIRNIILVGPAHFVTFFGIATTFADSFITPLGAVEVNHELVKSALECDPVLELDQAFQQEHCLEVQLPFISELFPNAKITPLLVGNAKYSDVATLLKKLWGDKDTLIIISSDLSHYHDYKTANKLDQATSDAIESIQPDKMEPHSACGKIPIQGLLQCAKEFGLKVNKLDLRNSGDTAGDKSRVVGYGAYYLC
jgi:AmmeMemoRadiSam system protein B